MGPGLKEGDDTRVHQNFQRAMNVEMYRGHQVAMDGAVASKKPEFPHHEAWVAVAGQRSCKANCSNLVLLRDDGMVLASGLLPAVHHGMCFRKMTEGLFGECISTGTCSA